MSNVVKVIEISSQSTKGFEDAALVKPTMTGCDKKFTTTPNLTNATLPRPWSVPLSPFSRALRPNSEITTTVTPLAVVP